MATGIERDQVTRAQQGFMCVCEFIYLRVCIPACVHIYILVCTCVLCILCVGYRGPVGCRTEW